MSARDRAVAAAPVAVTSLTLAQRAQLGPDRRVITPDGITHTLGNVVVEWISDDGEHTKINTPGNVTAAQARDYTKIKAYSKTTDQWLDLLNILVIVDPPTPRPVLELSTAHLPEALGARHLDKAPGVIAYRMRYGWLLWVPDDPAADAEESEHEVPPEVVTVQRYARALGCDWIMFDADGAATDDLPRWEW